MNEYRINLSDVVTLTGFITAFNDGLIAAVGGHWNGNLDAFNDYLCWPSADLYHLVIDGWTRCEAAMAKESGPSGKPLLVEVKEILLSQPQVVVTFG